MVWRVTRHCCTFAYCVDCHQRGTTGQLDKRARILHMSTPDKVLADIVAKNWAQYGARVELSEEASES